MDKDPEASKLPKQVAQTQRIKRTQFLNGQIIACQDKLDIASQQFAVAQSVLAEAREQLKIAQLALERIASEI